MKKLAFALFAITMLAAGILVQRLLPGNTEVTAATTIPDKLPDFTLPDITGQPHRISEWQGKLLIINFWATWCPPCLKEIPEFIKFQQEYRDQDVQFIGISIEDAETVKLFTENHNINYPILIGGDKGITLSQQLGNIINALPFTVIADINGNIVHRQPGEISRVQLLNVIEPLLDGKQP